MKTDFREACNQCPFRRKSLPGWLGPWTASEIVLSLAATPFPCHQTITDPDDDKVRDFEDDSLQGCAGAAIFLNNKVERSYCPETMEHQAKVADVDDSVKREVFKWGHEFVDYHEAGP